MSNFMKTRLMGAELLHAEGQTDVRTYGRTDMTKLTVSFRSFTNAPKNSWIYTFTPTRMTMA